MTISKEILVEKLDQLERAYSGWQEVEGKIEELFGAYSYEGGLGQAVDSFLSLSVDMFALVSGIDAGVLWWWMLEAKFGESATCTGVCRKAGEPLTYLKSNAEFIDWELELQA